MNRYMTIKKNTSYQKGIFLLYPYLIRGTSKFDTVKVSKNE